MSSYIWCDVYLCDNMLTQRIYAGTRKVKICPLIPDEGADAEVLFQRFVQTGAVATAFGCEWFTIQGFGGGVDPFAYFGVNSNLPLLTDFYGLLQAGFNMVELDVVSNDDNIRKIYIHFEDNASDVQRHAVTTYYEYILNGVVKVTTSLTSNQSSSYTVIGGGDYSASKFVTTLPWLIKYYKSSTHEDVETFGWYLINSDYVRSLDGQGPIENPTIGMMNFNDDFPGDKTEGFIDWLHGLEPEEEDDEDPYPDPDDDDDSDDPQPDPLPGISVVGSGFATIFTPSKTQLRNLAGLFWNETVFDFFQNLVENISDMFLSLAMVPFTVTAGSTVSVRWLGIDTAVSLTLAASQFMEFDMGSINLGGDTRIWRSNSALDYSPFSQLGIYLPFIGFRDLDIDDCRNKVMNLKYRIDILSGECVAIISLNGAVLYQFSGNCLTQIPLTNEGMQSLVADAVQVGLTVAAVSSAAGAASGEVAAESAANGGIAEKIGEFRGALQTSSAGRQLASTTANAVIGGKPMFNKTGSVSGAGGLLAVRQPYLYLKTPVSAIPDYYRRYCGYPCNKTGKLKSFTGYTVVEDIRLNGLTATAPEVAEIYSLLKGGVII